MNTNLDEDNIDQLAYRQREIVSRLIKLTFVQKFFTKYVYFYPIYSSFLGLYINFALL